MCAYAMCMLCVLCTLWACYVINHAQVLIGSLRLEWPAPIRTLLQLLDWDFIAYVQPECVINNSVAVAWLVAYLPAALTLLLLRVAWKASRRWPRLELWLFLAFASSFTQSLRFCFDLMVKMGLTRSSDLSFYVLGVLIGLLLLGTVIQLVHYYRGMILEAKQRHEDADADVKYITIRFIPRCKYWQLVIWMRQALLFVATAVSRVLQFIVPKRSSEDETYLWTVYAVTGSVVLLLVLFLGQHLASKPYWYTYQDVMER